MSDAENSGGLDRKIYDEVCDYMEERLVPVFAQVGQMLSELRAKTEEVEQFQQRLVESLGGAVQAHRKSSLSEMIGGSFGPDIEALNPLFQDMTGQDYATKLIDTLMQSDEEPTEEGIRGLIDQDKRRYGKYIGLQMPPEEEQTSEMIAEPKEEAESEHEELGKEPPEEEYERGTDTAEKMGAKKTGNVREMKDYATQMAERLGQASTNLMNRRSRAEPEKSEKKAVGK